MDSNLAVFYLSILLVLLCGVGITIFRQIFKTRKLETSLARLQNKLAKDKGTTQEHYELGSIYLNKKLYSQAISTLQKALKTAEEEGEENIAPIYNALGYSYFAQEQYDLAIRQYKEALKQNSNYVTALNNLGHVYERKNLTAQALQTYEQVLESEPQNNTAKRRAESLRKRVATST
ncbi:tetratricopeptide repeat protein [Chroococcidiopsis sp. CCMEE 29]|uniref:tetratricopeptide repeat protein n=1 Tax=Chroococcidiopsis sp. CCMEE 29 TaxID=155894 RepID=UPI0020213B60|nr:tetratricopeptide repeat protein [Chroococcidiopsis sp. CCMEE 29]